MTQVIPRFFFIGLPGRSLKLLTFMAPLFVAALRSIMQNHNWWNVNACEIIYQKTQTCSSSRVSLSFLFMGSLIRPDIITAALLTILLDTVPPPTSLPPSHSRRKGEGGREEMWFTPDVNMKVHVQLVFCFHVRYYSAAIVKLWIIQIASRGIFERAGIQFVYTAHERHWNVHTTKIPAIEPISSQLVLLCAEGLCLLKQMSLVQGQSLWCLAQGYCINKSEH